MHVPCTKLNLKRGEFPPNLCGGWGQKISFFEKNVVNRQAFELVPDSTNSRPATKLVI